jgi:hypothetical protein
MPEAHGAFTRAQLIEIMTFQRQADATLSQANPVSAQKYTVLATALNVRILSIEAAVTWTVQPTPLEIVVTIDGQTIVYSKDNPASATAYFAVTAGANTALFQALSVTDGAITRSFLMEGRSVKIEARTTGGTVSLLTSKVKYEQRT